MTYSYSGWMSSYSYTRNFDDAGVHIVTVTVSDGSLTDSQDVTITVLNTNRAPVLKPISDMFLSDDFSDGNMEGRRLELGNGWYDGEENNKEEVRMQKLE